MMKRLFLLLCLAGIAFSFQMNLNASSFPKYLVIFDLDKDDWQYRYTDEHPDLTNDNCRTTELWLRYIPAGTFMMGSPEYEWGRIDWEVQHKVTLTKPFYIGVFECTQQQWEHVMGDRPSYFNNNLYYATRPVERVSYNMIRGTEAGAGWPSSDAVDADSFMGVLREKTGLAFDLPTEAQWEYACRAGTTTALNSGKNVEHEWEEDANMDEVGRYYYNGDQGYSQNCDTTYGTAKVGSYRPNAWGRYDMHGNVEEWCLDWYGYYSASAATNPAGDTTGSNRVQRGGCWSSDAFFCRSAVRDYREPLSDIANLGFRVLCVPPEAYAVTVVKGTADKTEAAAGETVAITANMPASGQTFDKWTGDVEFANETAPETTFEMPANAVTVTATYKAVPKYRVTVKNGTADKTQAYAGETITIEAKDPAEHQQFDSWTGDVDFVDATATETTFVMPANNVTVTATYLEDAKYMVTVVGGKASKKTAYEGDVITVTANKPASGQAFDAWTGDVEFDDATATPTTFTMPGNAVTVTATFKTVPKTYKIVVVNGTSDKAKAAAGETVTLTANPAPAGKVFDKWTGGAVFADPTSMTTTFVMPAKAVTPKALYKRK